MAAAGLAPWIQYTRPISSATMVLVCFPHAGGAASAYREWTTTLADYGIEVWPVQLPGRENRFSEPFVTDLALVAAELAGLLRRQLADRPYAIHGHSAGAMMAYALAMTVTANGSPCPLHLFLGACRPLSRPDPDYPIHQLAPEPFRRRLIGYGRIPDYALEFPEMAERMLATARADLRLVETHDWSRRPLLRCPVTAFGGITDETVPTSTLADWGAITTGPFDTAILPGGHFPGPAAERHLLEVIRRGC